jgi:threonine/homoserine efflux transporter RhtA
MWQGVGFANSNITSLLFVIEEAEGIDGVGASISMFAGVCNAIEILAGSKVRGEKRRVLVPRWMLEIVVCP